MKKMSLGSVVKKERERQGLSLTDAAKICGVSKQYLHHFEQGQMSPSLDKADAILKGLGLSAVIGTLDRRKRISIANFDA